MGVSCIRDTHSYAHVAPFVVCHICDVPIHFLCVFLGKSFDIRKGEKQI